MPSSPKAIDQAAVLRQLVASSRKRDRGDQLTVAVVGASVHSGAARLATALQHLSDQFDDQDRLHFVVVPPSDDSLASTVARSAPRRLLVVTPDEDDLVAGFIALKIAAREGLLDESLGLVANRCRTARDASFVLQTLVAMCRRHLHGEPSWLAAVSDGRRCARVSNARGVASNLPGSLTQQSPCSVGPPLAISSAAPRKRTAPRRLILHIVYVSQPAARCRSLCHSQTVLLFNNCILDSLKWPTCLDR